MNRAINDHRLVIYGFLHTAKAETGYNYIETINKRVFTAMAGFDNTQQKIETCKNLCNFLKNTSLPGPRMFECGNIAYLVHEYFADQNWNEIKQQIMKLSQAGEKNELNWYVYKLIYAKYHPTLKKADATFIQNIENGHHVNERRWAENELKTFSCVDSSDFPNWYEPMQYIRL